MSHPWDKTRDVAGDAADAVAKGTKAAVSATGHAVEKTAEVGVDQSSTAWASVES
jgi:hypothetical protein